VAASWKGYAVPGVKYALRKRGFRAGNARLPLPELPAEPQACIDAALDAALALV
jgi:dihydrodipicolinate synthase/N-acetylneuraminate lyase